MDEQDAIVSFLRGISIGDLVKLTQTISASETSWITDMLDPQRMVKAIDAVWIIGAIDDNPGENPPYRIVTTGTPQCAPCWVYAEDIVHYYDQESESK